ncbi:MAG: class I SAM-dependent methyltransferase [Bacteroidota bacterium]
MDDQITIGIPDLYPLLKADAERIGFTMPSDLQIGSLLKTLVRSKPGSNLLELGTGAGLSLAWMVDGMDTATRLTTIDNDPLLIEMVQNHFGKMENLEFICTDGTEWIKNYEGEKFDLIFADAWPGKYSEIDETLLLLEPGGFYIVDDMTAQPNWPEGHQKNVDRLVEYLENRPDLSLTKLNWSTGVIIAVKIS